MDVRDRIKELRRVPASELVPHPENWRTHPEEQKTALMAVLQEVGYAQALVCREIRGGKLQIIDGHLRADTTPDAIVPVLVLDVTAKEAKKLLASMDPITQLAEADQDQLAALLESLDAKTEEFQHLVQFVATIHDINIGDEQEMQDEDEPLPDIPDKPIAKRGDVWGLGDHLLLCGDAVTGNELELLMSKRADVDMVFTDPPWNVGIGLDSNPRHLQREGLVNDNISDEDFIDFLNATARTLHHYCKGDMYCMMGCERWPNIDAVMRNAGFHWSATIIWAKDIFVLGRSKYHRQYEPIWYGWPEKSKSSFRAGRDKSDLWEFDRPRVSAEHPTMKPIELVQHAINNSSKPGDVVFDPFVGSGTTIIAAEQLGRICYSVEIDPGYVDVAVKRWENFTGQKAKKI